MSEAGGGHRLSYPAVDSPDSISVEVGQDVSAFLRLTEFVPA